MAEDTGTRTESDAARYASAHDESVYDRLADVPQGVAPLHPRARAWISGRVSTEDLLRMAGVTP